MLIKQWKFQGKLIFDNNFGLSDSLVNLHLALAQSLEWFARMASSLALRRSFTTKWWFQVPTRGSITLPDRSAVSATVWSQMAALWSIAREKKHNNMSKISESKSQEQYLPNVSRSNFRFTLCTTNSDLTEPLSFSQPTTTLRERSCGWLSPQPRCSNTGDALVAAVSNSLEMRSKRESTESSLCKRPCQR